MSTIGVIIPAYNEKENLVRLCDEILKQVPDATILIMDDSPGLDSVNLIKNKQYRQVEIFHRETKGGRGSAVILGLSMIVQKNLRYYIEMDADFSHPPEQLPELIHLADKSELDLLIASRYTLNSRILNWPLSRRLFSKMSNILAKVLLEVPVSDYTNGYRLYSHKAALEISKSCGKRGSGFIALSEILVCLYYKKYKVSEVSTIFTNRIRGASSLSIKEIANALVGLKNIYLYKLRLSK